MTAERHADGAGRVPATGIPLTPSRLRPGASRLRLQTLVRLRWLAVAGQTLAVLVVYVGLDFPLPLGFCLAVIALSAWLNIFLALRYRANLRLRNRYAALLLGYDVIQLAVLLYLTGGLQNPFSFLFIVPATVSATTLPLRRTVPIAVLTFACVTLLALFHQPLPWYRGEALHLPAIYIFGIWAALVSGLVFNAIYAWRVADETRRMSDALAATETVLAHEQRLSALDGLAAAAAHELGTPLATIALVAKELQRELPDLEAHRDDLELLRSQAERCRGILATLSSRPGDDDEAFARMPLSVVLEETVGPLRGEEADVEVRLEALDDSPEPTLARNPGIVFALGNLLDNAIDFAAVRVDVRGEWNARTVAITIEDDGPGFAQEIIDKLGEPYVTTRRARAMNPGSSHGGMGLGFFIAKTLLERSGAGVALANRPAPAHGAVVRVEWPRAAIEAVVASGDWPHAPW